MFINFCDKHRKNPFEADEILHAHVNEADFCSCKILKNAKNAKYGSFCAFIEFFATSENFSGGRECFIGIIFFAKWENFLEQMCRQIPQK